MLDLSFSEMEREVVDVMGESPYRAKQLWNAMYRECLTDFSDITTLPLQLRDRLKDSYIASPLQEAIRLSSSDGTTDKSLFRLLDGELIETVLMRYSSDGHRKERKTVCLSTQAGCSLGCTFCATGQQGFRRQLTVGEIVAQVTHAQRLATIEDAKEENASAECRNHMRRGVTNVVFMGMGEPLANYDNCMKAIRILNDPLGIGIGARHITISTVGLVPQILRMAREKLQINLAVSLHAADDETRSETMPINRRYPIAQLIAACRQYVGITGRRIFFEYVLLKEQNDSIPHARRLGRLLIGLTCHVNLIPVNPTSEGMYARTSRGAAEKFQTELRRHGIPSTLRMEKGIDINAGCGQLRAREIGLGDLGS